MTTNPFTQAASDLADQQDKERGPWPNPRETQQPSPPWPNRSSSVLGFLLHNADEALRNGDDIRQVLTHLAVHAWFEGGVENYDRGQRDAREAAK